MKTYTIKKTPESKKESKVWPWAVYKGRHLLIGQFSQGSALDYAEWCNDFGEKAVIKIYNAKGELKRKYSHQVVTKTIRKDLPI